MILLKNRAQKLKLETAQFGRNNNGQFAVIFAFCAFAVTMAAGLAVDGARIFSAKADLNSAIDAAILATTRDLTNGAITVEQAQDAAQKFLFTNLDPDGSVLTPATIDRFAINPDTNVVTMDAHVDLPMTFAAIAGWDTVEVASTSSALFNDNTIEIAMALDVTGSMAWTVSDSDSTIRIDALESAAKLAINTLTSGELKDRVRIGLAPYAQSVNVTPVLGSMKIQSSSNGCVLERTGTEKYTGTMNSSNLQIKGVSQDPGTNYCPENAVTPLTNDQELLLEKIGELETKGGTAGHMGIAWAQYLLSADWASVWPINSAPSSATNTEKYAIFLTDGQFNTFDNVYNEDINASPATTSRTYTDGICSNMKGNGIKIYSIIFSQEDATAQNVMSNCSSGTGYFFNASTSAELEAAFEEIAKDISKLRLTN